MHTNSEKCKVPFSFFRSPFLLNMGQKTKQHFPDSLDSLDHLWNPHPFPPWSFFPTSIAGHTSFLGMSKGMAFSLPLLHLPPPGSCPDLQLVYSVVLHWNISKSMIVFPSKSVFTIYLGGVFQNSFITEGTMISTITQGLIKAWLNM